MPAECRVAVDAGAEVYFGGAGATFDATLDVLLTGDTAGLRFGGSVASAGDVNGEGFADVVVGVLGYRSLFDTLGNPRPKLWRAYVFMGGATFDATIDTTLVGVVGERFGRSVASIVRSLCAATGTCARPT